MNELIVWLAVVLASISVSKGLWLQTEIVFNKKKINHIFIWKLSGLSFFCVFITFGKGLRIFELTTFFLLCGVFLSVATLARKKRIR